MDARSYLRSNWALGFVPLALFLARLYELAGGFGVLHILWVCHISSLVMALGFFTARIELVRVSVLWLILGAPLWPLEILRTGLVEITSIGTHYVALVFGLWTVRQFGMSRRSWWYALMWFLLLQTATRAMTPPDYNVNLAYSTYPGWEKLFPAYWQYAVFLAVSAAAALRAVSAVVTHFSRRRSAAGFKVVDRI